MEPWIPSSMTMISRDDSMSGARKKSRSIESRLRNKKHDLRRRGEGGGVVSEMEEDHVAGNYYSPTFHPFPLPYRPNQGWEYLPRLRSVRPFQQKRGEAINIFTSPNTSPLRHLFIPLSNLSPYHRPVQGWGFSSLAPPPPYSPICNPPLTSFPKSFL